jgi:hypothetical protein
VQTVDGGVDRLQPQLALGMYVLRDDDRVVDHDTDHHDHSGHRYDVDVLAERRKQKHRPQNRDRYPQRHPERRAHAQEHRQQAQDEAEPDQTVGTNDVQAVADVS